MGLEEELAQELGDDEAATEDDPSEDEAVEVEDEEDEEDDQDTDTDPDALSLGEHRDKEWARVAKYLAKNLGEIEGEDATHYVECFVCRSFGTPGWLIPGPPPVEIVGTLHEWLGMRLPDEYVADTHSVECDECAGLGSVRMPSHVPGQETMSCVKCGGLGWLGSDAKRGNYDSPPTNGLTAVPAPDYTIGSGQLAPETPEPPEVQALRDAGYMVAKIPAYTA